MPASSVASVAPACVLRAQPYGAREEQAEKNSQLDRICFACGRLQSLWRNVGTMAAEKMRTSAGGSADPRSYVGNSHLGAMLCPASTRRRPPHESPRSAMPCALDVSPLPLCVRDMRRTTHSPQSALPPPRSTPNCHRLSCASSRVRHTSAAGSRCPRARTRPELRHWRAQPCHRQDCAAQGPASGCNARSREEQGSRLAVRRAVAQSE